MVRLQKSTPIMVVGSIGYNLGAGIQYALLAEFKNIISIELSDKYYEYCKNKYEKFNNIKIIKGDSGLCLWVAIKEINEPITFWLDAHFCGGDTAHGIRKVPLEMELEQINRHPIKTHTFLIDDVRNLKLEKSMEIIKEINKDYKFTYADGYIPNDVLVCKT